MSDKDKKGIEHNSEFTNSRHVPLKDLAAEVGYSQNGFARALKNRGFNPYQLKAASNAPYFVSYEDAESFKNLIKNENELIGQPLTKPEELRSGGVYLVEVPSYVGRRRFKLGWADCFKDRLSTYRTIVPDLRVLSLWHTNDRWIERAAQKVAVTRGRSVTAELFEFDNPDEAITKIKLVLLEMGIACSDYEESQ